MTEKISSYHACDGGCSMKMAAIMLHARHVGHLARDGGHHASC
jgi:hypothetical protein